MGALSMFDRYFLTHCSVCGKSPKQGAIVSTCVKCGRRICRKCANKVYEQKGRRRHDLYCAFCLAALAHDKKGLTVYIKNPPSH